MDFIMVVACPTLRFEMKVLVNLLSMRAMSFPTASSRECGSTDESLTAVMEELPAEYKCVPALSHRVSILKRCLP